MTPFDEYDSETGESRATMWRRQAAAERNFVAPAAAPLARREPQTIDVMPAWLTPAQQLDVAAAWQPAPGARENTSAMDRAQALRVRLLPFALLWGLLGVVVGVVVLIVAQNAPGAALVGLLTFVAMSAITYVRLNGDDYRYSREGTERHRIDRATQLQLAELDHKARMQEKALDAYIRQLERNG